MHECRKRGRHYSSVFFFLGQQNIYDKLDSNRFSHYGDWQADHICIIKNMRAVRLIEELGITEKLYVIDL